jgi:hypothetical protein
VSDPRFYAMYYVDSENRNLSSNVPALSFDEQMCIFLGCCETLGRSLKYYTGLDLTVLTNDRAYVEQLSTELKCEQVDFPSPIPHGIRFFASLHRIDLYEYFSRQEGYSLLIESDAVCLNPIPVNLQRCVDLGIPTYCDVTDQVYPSYGREVVLEDKERLMGCPSVGLWAGGDWIGGNAKFFRELYDGVREIRSNYYADYDSYFHQGDEMLTSVALEKIMRRRYVCDVSTFGGMGRYWGIQTAHVQRPTAAYLDHFLMHLPADKRLLASYSIPAWIKKEIVA